MKKKILVCTFSLLLGVFFMTMGSSKAAIKWDENQKIRYFDGVSIFYAYGSQDNKSCWIYNVRFKYTQPNVVTLTFPKKIDGKVVRKIGDEEKEIYCEEENDGPKSLFGEGVEPYEDSDGYRDELNSITSLDLPSTVNEITAYAFSGLHSLKKVVLPASLTSIRPYLFYGCRDLKKVTIPTKLTSTKNLSTAFVDCDEMSTIAVPKKCKRYTVTKGLLMNKKKTCLYMACASVKDITIPKTVKKVDDFALNYANGEKLTIPASVNQIGKQALSSCMESVKLNKKNKTFVKDGSTIYKKKDKSLVASLVINNRINISSKVKMMSDSSSIIGSPAVNRIDVPASIKAIAGFLTLDEGARPSVFFHGLTPPTGFESNEYYEIYVPEQAKNAYQTFITNEYDLVNFHTFA